MSFALENQVKELTEKVERYEKALLSIVENPTDWSKSYSKAYTDAVRISVKALKLNE